MKLIKNALTGETALVHSLDGYPEEWETVLEDAPNASALEQRWDDGAQAFVPVTGLYADKRRLEYPPLEDFADALYWKEKGDDSKWLAYVAACDAVKAKYEKDEA